MSEKDRLELEQECLLKYSKAQMINKYIDELAENEIITNLALKNRQEADKYKIVLDKIKEIPSKHIDNANEELQIILRNNNDLEYKNQCSHDFDIIRKNVEIIYKEILELLEEIE